MTVTPVTMTPSSTAFALSMPPVCTDLSNFREGIFYSGATVSPPPHLPLPAGPTPTKVSAGGAPDIFVSAEP